MSFSYTSDRSSSSSSSSSSSHYAFSSIDYSSKPSRPASITSVQTTSTTSTQKSDDDKFLSSDQTYSAYLQQQAAAKRPRNVNVYTTCGRHSNEWLFSGWFRK